MYTTEDIKIMYAYYLDLLKDPNVLKEDTWFLFDKKNFDELGNITDIKNKFYQYLVDYCGYNTPPKVISDELYEKFDAPEVYHGFTKFSHPISLLSNWNYHYGQGIMPGFYTTNSFGHAKRYTLEEEYLGFTNKQRIMKLKLNAENPIGIDDINQISKSLGHVDMDKIEAVKRFPHIIPQLKLLCDFANNKVQEEKKLENAKGFMEMFSVGSTLAVFLGFDTIIYKSDESNLAYYIELDRSKLILSEREAQRFMKKGGKLKNLPLNVMSDEDANKLIYQDTEEIQK